MGLHKFKKNMTGGEYYNIAKMITLLVKLLDRCLAACDWTLTPFEWACMTYIIINWQYFITDLLLNKYVVKRKVKFCLLDMIINIELIIIICIIRTRQFFPLIRFFYHTWAIASTIGMSIAVVAVLEIHIERNPVVSMKPNIN